MSDLQAIVPPHLTVRVICEGGHLLTGLFVAFKLKPRTDGSVWDEVARVMEVVEDPGEAPVDPARERLPNGRARQPTKKDRNEHAARSRAWERRREASLETPPDPSRRFVLGFVDDQGFLVPTHERRNPWYEAAAGVDPDSYKLGLGEVYEVCAIRHPDPALARAVVRHLNGAAQVGDARYGIASWGAMLRDVTVETHATESGDQYVWKLTENATHYVPPGPPRYGGWTLYRDMPHCTCAGVPDQVEKLQDDLAKLRYPTGEGDPFEFRAKTGKNAGAPILKTWILSRSLSARVRWAREKAAKPDAKLPAYMKDSVFYVQSQVAAAMGRFLEHVREGRAFALSQKDAAHRGRNWAYLLGEELELDGSDPRGWQVPEHTYLGVADRFLASMAEHWIAHGLRKPGSILIKSVETGLWMQERAAVAVDAWSLLLKAFGARYGLVGGSSFRRLVDDPWAGSIKASLHNTGLAIDLAGGGRRHSIERWPVRFEADWVEKKRRPARGGEEGKPSVAAERAKLDYQLYFRIYAHSDLDVFRGDEAMAALRAALSELAGTDESKGRLVRLFEQKGFGDLDDPQVPTLALRFAQPGIAHARALAAATADDLRARFFRREVHQFLANPYEADAGTALAAHGPREGTADFPSVAWARAWVNASALGYDVGIERIAAHQTDVRDNTNLWGTEHEKGRPVPISVMGYMRRGETQDLVHLLDDICAPPSEAPENIHYDRPIPIRLSSKASAPVVATVLPRDIDHVFVRDWRDEVAKMPAAFRPATEVKEGLVRALGAQINVVLSALTGSGGPLGEVLALLSGRFASKSFLMTHAGARARGLHIDAGMIWTGARLAQYLRVAADQFQEAFRERWGLDEPQQAAGGEKTKISREQRRKQQQSNGVAWGAPDWTVIVQPIFVTTGPRAEDVPFLPAHFAFLPPSSSANHLEWWHYQHRDAGRSWGEAIAELGLSTTVLGAPRFGAADPAPAVHRGCGYGDDLDNKPGSLNAGAPANHYAPLAGG